MPVLETLSWPRTTARLSIRPATADDVDPTWRFRRLPEVAEWVTTAPSSLEEYSEHFLEEERLAVAAYPHGLAPEGAVADPAELSGRVLAGAAGPGQPLTETALVGPGLLTGQDGGVTAVTLRIDDPGVLRHVRAGDHVDVVHLPDGAAPGGRQVLGRGLPVLWVSSADPGGDGGLLAGPGTSEEEGLLVVGAPHEGAAQLAGAGGTGRTTVVLVPAPVSPSAEAAGP